MGENRIDGEWDRAREEVRQKDWQKEMEWDSEGRAKVKISFSFTIH